MTRVDNHPNSLCRVVSLSAPVIFGLLVMIINTIIMGAAQTPLMTALQKSRLNGIN